jgi:ribosomal protein L15
VLRFFLVCGFCFVVRRRLMPLTSSSSRRRGSILGSGVAGEHAHRDGTRRSQGAYLGGPRHPREGGDPFRPAVWRESTLIEVELDGPGASYLGGAEFHLGHRCARRVGSSRWSSTVPGCVPKRASSSSRRRGSTSGIGVAGEHAHRGGTRRPRGRDLGGAEFHLGHRCARRVGSSRCNSTVPGCVPGRGRVPPRP